MRHNEFFKFYLWYMVAAALLSSVPMLLWGFTDNDPTPNSPFVIVLNIVATVLGLGSFVLSIVALVLFVKRKYAKISWLLPIGYFITVVVGFIFSAVYSVMMLGQQFEQLGPDPDPAEIQALGEALSSDIPLPFVITALVRTLIIVSLAVVVWVKSADAQSVARPLTK